jgi:hypothetical protein
MDFKVDMRLRDPILQQEDEEFILPFEFSKSGLIHVNIHGKFFPEIILAWVMMDI